MNPKRPEPSSTIRHRLFEVIFETDTRAGKAFDISLISVLAVLLESVASLQIQFGTCTPSRTNARASAFHQWMRTVTTAQISSPM